jgi:RimJ/RimL family protein N-acetyltransferase
MNEAGSRRLLGAVRVRTPRLELRLASDDELRALARVARGGVHPPERTPFAVPWTDRAQLPGFVEEFVAFHRGQLEAWNADDWNLNLVAFLAGRPVGSQSLRGERFAETRIVDTGSWLGSPWQNRGLGAEMRAGVLELAFRGLDAIAAKSGAFADNPQSARVSAKLGYREVGEATVFPRGTPVRERIFRIERAAWTSPVAVELEGVEPALPLFGAG